MKATIIKYNGEGLQYFLLDMENKELKVSDISMPSFLTHLLRETMNGRYYGNAIDKYAETYGLSRRAAELLVQRGPEYTKFFEKVQRRSVWRELEKTHEAKLVNDTD